MSNDLTKKQKILYNAYMKKQDAYDEELRELEQDRQVIIAPFEEQRAELKKRGGERTRVIDAEIEQLSTQIKEINAEYEQKINDIWTDFYDKTSLLGTREKLDKRKIASKVFGVAMTAGVSGAIAKFANKKSIEANMNEQFYLEHSEYAQGFMNFVKENIEESKKSDDPQIRAYAELYDTQGMTTTNFLEKMSAGIQANFDSIKDDPKQMDILIKELENAGLLDSSLDISTVLEQAKSDAILSLKNTLFENFNTAEIAHYTPDYTIPAVGVSAGLSALLIFGPYLYATAKLHFWNKKQERQKSVAVQKEQILLTERDEITKGIDDQIAQKTKEKESAYDEDILYGLAMIDKEQDEATQIIDLKIERIKLLSDISYNNYLKQLAQEGADLAVAKNFPAKTIRVGKPYSYQMEIEKSQEKVAEIEKILEPYSATTSKQESFMGE